MESFPMRVNPEGQEKNTSVPINVSPVLGVTLSLRSSFGQILFVTKTCNLFIYPLCVVQVNNPESWNAQIYRIFKLTNNLYLYHGTWQVQSVVPIFLLVISSPSWKFTLCLNIRLCLLPTSWIFLAGIGPGPLRSSSLLTINAVQLNTGPGLNYELTLASYKPWTSGYINNCGGRDSRIIYWKR